MRAVVLGAYATKPAALLAEQSDVAPTAGEIRVRIEATALNPLDAKIATGAMKDWFPVRFPYVPGTDFAGVVEAIGAGVSDLAPGDLVFGRADPVKGGGVATHIVIDAERVAHRPVGVPAEFVACLPTPAGMALQSLDAMHRHEHEPLLILGEGAVARTAAALAGSAARRVTSPADLATAPVARHLFDAAGGDLQRAAVERLPEGSQVIGIVSPVDEDVAVRRRLCAEFAVLETSRSQLQEIARRAAAGEISLHPDRIVAFHEAASAFDSYVARDLVGKVVVAGDRRS